MIVAEASKVGFPVIDLRGICVDEADYSPLSPIEPSSIGGMKIVKRIAAVVQGFDFKSQKTANDWISFSDAFFSYTMLMPHNPIQGMIHLLKELEKYPWAEKLLIGTTEQEFVIAMDKYENDMFLLTIESERQVEPPIYGVEFRGNSEAHIALPRVIALLQEWLTGQR